MRARTICCAGVAALSMSACAPAFTPEEVEFKMKAATAAALEVDAASVEILDPQSTYTRRIWTARVAEKTFACDAERSFALPDCTAIS